MPTPPAQLPASACWEIRDDTWDAAADLVQMNNPHAEGVPWTSAVAAMSQRSENEAFLEGTPSAGWALMKSEPLTCKLSQLSTETVCQPTCISQPLLPEELTGTICSPVFVLLSVSSENPEAMA